MTIAITSPTGKIGRELLALARQRDVPLRALVRDPQRLQGAVGHAVPFDFTDATTHAPALAGVDTLVLISPSGREQAAADRAVLAAARTAGVRHLVRLSADGADEAATRFAAYHRDLEADVRASGIGWTIVRPTFFMENLLPRAAVIAAGTFPSPIGDARMTQVAVTDIAEVLLAIATSPAVHAGATYILTGPTADTGAEIAATLATAAAHPVRFVSPPEATLRENLERAGLDEWAVAGVLEGFAKVRDGAAARVTADVERVLGRPPTSFAAWAKEHARAFA